MKKLISLLLFACLLLTGCVPDYDYIESQGYTPLGLIDHSSTKEMLKCGLTHAGHMYFAKDGESLIVVNVWEDEVGYQYELCEEEELNKFLAFENEKDEDYEDDASRDAVNQIMSSAAGAM